MIFSGILPDRLAAAASDPDVGDVVSVRPGMYYIRADNVEVWDGKGN